MFFLKLAFCRVCQTAFRIALPFLPYREPEIIKSCSELEYVFRKERIKSPLIVTDSGITRNSLTKPLEDILKKCGIAYIICLLYTSDAADE